MKFTDPKYTELFNALKDNKKLVKFFSKFHLLYEMDDYYENYGYNANNIDSAKRIIDNANDKIFEKLANTLLHNIDYIKEHSITYLISSQFLKEEIKDDLGLSQELPMTDDIPWEIFYTIKYCCVNVFFQNNWEFFIPEEDFTKMEKNESLMAFMDALMKEFDKLDNILDHTKDFHDYDEIPYEYIVYLTQLMGVEPKDFMIMEDQHTLYRTIAANIMDVYSIRGTVDSFELLFNFLGYTITLEEYFFDRRRLNSLSEANEEMITNDMYSYKFYMTTKDPRDNFLQEVSSKEIVTQKDFGEKLNVKDFDSLVKKYGLRCVLGYDDEYVVENEANGKVQSTDVKKYTGPVFTYFRTNYVRIKPKLKYASGNFSLEQLYQLGALLNFLTPEFIMREMYVVVDIGESDDKLILNWNRDKNADDFYMLDSEGWNNNQASKYLINWYDGAEIGYMNSGFSVVPYALKDSGKKVPYTNSLGMSVNYSGGKYNNTFLNPLSEKIKIINSTRYWGDKVKVDDNNLKKIYPVYRIDEMTKVNGRSYYNPAFKTKNGQVVELYLPGDSKTLAGSRDFDEWNKLEKVSLNGFGGSTLKNKIRTKCYPNGDYYDYEKNCAYRRNIEWVIDEPIRQFLNTKTPEEDWSENKKKFFATKWKKIDNYTWKAKFRARTKTEGWLEAFTSEHKNVINYDYVNKRLFCFNDFLYMGFSPEKNSFYFVERNPTLREYNAYANELVNRMSYPYCYYIAMDVGGVYYTVYQYELINKFKEFELLKYRPYPVGNVSKATYKYNRYVEIIDRLEDDSYYINADRSIKITSPNDIISYVFEDNSFYKFFKQTTYLRKIIHSNKNDELTKGIIDMREANMEETINNPVVGNFYYKDATLNDNKDFVSGEGTNIKDFRENSIWQYGYYNINVGDYIYSKADERLYKINSPSVYYIDGKIKHNGRINNSGYEIGKEGIENIYGVEEINFYGRFVLDGDKAYIYEYDDSWEGFSEQDDDDNFIFHNYERIYDWAKAKVYCDGKNNREYVISEDGAISTIEFDKLNNKRPIKVNIDKLYDKKDENNELSFNLLDEICSAYGRNYTGKDSVVLK
jgi:hypothetical protein